MAALDAELHALFLRILGDACQTSAGALEVGRGLLLAFANALELFLHKTARRPEASLTHPHEAVRVVAERRAAEMQHHKSRAEPGGEVDGLVGMFQRALAFAGIGGGKLVAVRRGAGDLDGERAEIVQAGKLHFAGLVHFQDAIHEREADAVAELDAVKAHVEQFAAHDFAIGVAGGIPAGRDRKHGALYRRSASGGQDGSVERGEEVCQRCRTGKRQAAD